VGSFATEEALRQEVRRLRQELENMAQAPPGGVRRRFGICLQPPPTDKDEESTTG